MQKNFKQNIITRLPFDTHINEIAMYYTNAEHDMRAPSNKHTLHILYKALPST